MKRLIFGLLMSSIAYSQSVIQFDVNCHQGLIDFTLVGSPGIYHLYSTEEVLIQGQYVDVSDTFYVTFSGIGEEMHSMDSMVLEYQDSILLVFPLNCGFGVEEPEVEVGWNVNYHNMYGQPCEPTGFVIEVRTRGGVVRVRKLFIN